MTGFRLMVGVVLIIALSFLWIPLNETVDLLRTEFNDLTTDADVIGRNNMLASIFYFSLFFMFIAIGLWLLRSALEGRGQQVIVRG